MKQKRQAKFREIFTREIDQLCLERTDIPGEESFQDALLSVVRAEQLRLDKDASAVGIHEEVKEQVNKLGDFIGGI